MHPTNKIKLSKSQMSNLALLAPHSTVLTVASISLSIYPTVLRAALTIIRKDVLTNTSAGNGSPAHQVHLLAMQPSMDSAVSPPSWKLQFTTDVQS